MAYPSYNQGQQPWRQRMAPQPGRGMARGARPMDAMRRQGIAGLAGNKPAGSMFGNMPQPQQAWGPQPRQPPQGRPQPLPNPTVPQPTGQPPQFGWGSWQPGDMNQWGGGQQPKPPGRGGQGQGQGQGQQGQQQGGNPYIPGDTPQEQRQMAKERAHKIEARNRKFFIEKGIPLTPELEQGMRSLESTYADTMLQLGIQEDEVMAMMDIAKNRLADAHKLSTRSVQEGAEDAGMFRSGVRQTVQDENNMGYGGEQQNLWLDTQAQIGGIGDARARALRGLQGGREDLLMDVIRGSVGDAAAGGASGLPTGNGRRRGSRNRRRRG